MSPVKFSPEVTAAIREARRNRLMQTSEQREAQIRERRKREQRAAWGRILWPFGSSIRRVD